MCGIFGFTNPQTHDLKNAKDALHSIAHRGPDQEGEWSDEKVYLGFRRLSIIDLSENGNQPMSDEESGIYLTFNGEIYNFQKLREELIQDFKFKSTSDTEVLVHGYKKWGIEGLLERIDGMYGLAIYDQKNNKLFLVRDRVGIKPLYWGYIEGKYIWASELKAIQKFYETKKLEIDYTAMYDFLTYTYIPAPKTMYKNVFKLEPANFIEIDLNSNSHQIKKYWSLPTSTKQISLEEAAEQLRVLIRKSIQEQMIADVPIGFFLSGGMDSSTVVALTSELSDQINTYSIGFDVKEHDETSFAEIVAQKFKTNHAKKILTKEDAMQTFSSLKRWYDEPFADTSAFPTYLVSKFTRETSTVALTGDGGDEVFGGYTWYKNFELFKEKSSNLISRIIEKIFKRGDLDKDLDEYSRMLGGLGQDKKEKYAKMWNIPKDYDEFWNLRRHYRYDLPVLTRMQYLDFHTSLPDDMLTKVDRASMAVSLEARVPLLSKDIIEFMFSLPEKIKFHNDELKGLMKYALKDILPQEIIERKKKGFSIPIVKWGSDFLGEYENRQEKILNELFKSEIYDKP